MIQEEVNHEKLIQFWQDFYDGVEHVATISVLKYFEGILTTHYRGKGVTHYRGKGVTHYRGKGAPLSHK